MTAARYRLAPIQAWLNGMLQDAGMSPEMAETGASALLQADVLGIHTHGLARFPTYWQQLSQGALKARPSLRAERAAGVLRIDADRAFGPWAIWQAVEHACDALDVNTAFLPFFLGNSGHMGALAVPALYAAERGRVVLLAQATQPVMGPAGAGKAAIGNNPIALAAPAGSGQPLLIDFASSVVALSHVLQAQRDRQPIPEHWAMDAQGQPTPSPEAALQGALLPMAGHKGLALAMMVQVLAMALTHSHPDMSHPNAAPGCGAFGFVLNPDAIAHGRFVEDMRSWMDAYRQAAGAAARFPGERALRERAAALHHGIAIHANLIDVLHRIGSESGRPFPV